MKKIISLMTGCFLIYGSAIAMEEARMDNFDDILAIFGSSAHYVAAHLGGGTPAMGGDLFQATKDGNAELVETLLRSGVDPKVVDYKGETPLHLACKIDMPSPMICDLAEEARLLATTTRNFIDAESVHCLDNIAMFSDFFSRHHIELPDSPARQAIVNALIKAGADVNKQSANKNTPLHYAAHYPMPKIMQSLIAAGADINRMNAKGKTPLNVANGPELCNIIAHNQLVALLSAGHPRCGALSPVRSVFHADSVSARVIAPFIRRAAFEDALYGHHEA